MSSTLCASRSLSDGISSSWSATDSPVKKTARIRIGADDPLGTDARGDHGHQLVGPHHLAQGKGRGHDDDHAGNVAEIESHVEPVVRGRIPEDGPRTQVRVLGELVEIHEQVDDHPQPDEDEEGDDVSDQEALRDVSVEDSHTLGSPPRGQDVPGPEEDPLKAAGSFVLSIRRDFQRVHVLDAVPENLVRIFLEQLGLIFFQGMLSLLGQ